MVWDTASWEAAGRVDDQNPYDCLAWSPDSAFLLAGWNSGGLRVWKVSERKAVLSIPRAAWGVAWSPDGRLLASASAGGEVSLIDARDGRIVHTLRDHTGRVHKVAWSPDGRRLASCSDDGSVRIYDAATAAPLLLLPCGPAQVTSLAWSGDSRRLACTCNDGTVRLWGSPDLEPLPRAATALETGVLARKAK